MKYATPLTLSAALLLSACSKSSSTSYSGPQTTTPPTEKRLIKFAYEGNVYGVPPIYEGLTDTPQHRFEGTGITESQFVRTKAGDTIHITIALSSEGTRPVVTAVTDDTERTPVPQTATQLPQPDATARFRIVVK